MIWRNTPERYGAVNKTLHWLIALGVLAMLVMGLNMDGIENPADRFWVYSIHKATGITILALMCVRLAWKLMNWGLPRPLPTHSRPEQVAAAVVHWGFYALLIAMPLSGWILTSAANSTINWFGLFPVPHIVEPSQDLGRTAEQVHEYISYAIWVFIALHLGGALKHMVIDRDGTLRRMLPFTAPVLFALMLVPGVARAADPVWVIDQSRSSLTFEAMQEGSPFKGQFKTFSGQVQFEPTRPDDARGSIHIDLASIDSQNAERDGSVKGADWFDVLRHPQATYTIEKLVTGEKAGDYRAIGVLELRGLQKPQSLEFNLQINGMEAHAVGKTTLKRLDFDVGGGEWRDESMVGNLVIVNVDVWLKQAGAQAAVTPGAASTTTVTTTMPAVTNAPLTAPVPQVGVSRPLPAPAGME